MVRVRTDRPVSLVLSNSYGTHNVGDEGLLVALIDGLRKRRADLDINVLTRHPDETAQKHPDAGTIRSGIIRGLVKTYRAIGRADLLIVGGGGLIQDASSLGNLLFHLSRPVMARLSGTPVVCCGLGVGPITSGLGRLLTGCILNGAHRICVRDESSAATLRELGVDEKRILVLADLALTLRFPESCEDGEAYRRIRELKGKAGCLIGVSLRPESGRHRPGATRSAGYQRFLDAMVSALDELIDMLDARLVFVSMHPEQDDPLGVELRQRLRDPERLVLLPGRLDPQTVMAAVGLLDLVIGMRLHTVIFSARSSIPFVAVGYDPKVTEFCRSLQQEARVVGMERLTAAELVRLCADTWEKREMIGASLRERVPGLQRIAERNLDVVLESLPDRGCDT